MQYIVVPLAGATESERNNFINGICLCCTALGRIDAIIPSHDEPNAVWGDGSWDDIPWTTGAGAMNLVGAGAITRPVITVAGDVSVTGGGALQAGDVILVRTAPTARAPGSFVTAVTLTAANLPAPAAPTP
jgi:hypothetical protein